VLNRSDVDITLARGSFGLRGVEVAEVDTRGRAKDAKAVYGAVGASGRAVEVIVVEVVAEGTALSTAEKRSSMEEEVEEEVEELLNRSAAEEGLEGIALIA